MTDSQKGTKKKRPIIVVSATLTAILLATTAVLYVAWQITRPLHFPPDKVYLLERGQNSGDLAIALYEDGVISQTKLFDLTAKWGGYSRNLKAGEYRFKDQSSIIDVLETVVKGKSLTYKITFIEGWTYKDILAEIATKKNLQQTLDESPHTDFLSTLGIKQSNPEGWFFPDTYRYTKDQLDTALLTQSHEAMLQTLSSEWESRAPELPYENIYEGLIAASIIQKESGVESEFATISGVIVNRLRRGMRLQMDPTVIYGLGDDYTGKIKKSDLKRDTEYNTYTRYGLPPTPIAMPGLAAIRAALQPETTSALYFVAKGDGTHQFSDNFEDHQVAVREYRKLQRK